MNEIISYLEMCRREGASLQRGMNYQLGGGHSVILMSLRPGAPYDDYIDYSGALVYEGHDAPRGDGVPDPKAIDQPAQTDRGALTQNGLFHRAAQEYQDGQRDAERVHVYEKIRKGIWSNNGAFTLVDSWREDSGGRQVFKFRLIPTGETAVPSPRVVREGGNPRLIPSHVKIEVYGRDKGRCVKCGATDELHFDHVVPIAKGGTSIRAENIQLLCARHNIEKSDRIV